MAKEKTFNSGRERQEQQGLQDRQQEAIKLMGSPRGQYIIGQALALAVKELEKVEDKLQEKSNIQDMKFMGEAIFMAGFVTHSMLSPELLGKIKDKLGNNPDKMIEDTELVQEINDEVKALTEAKKVKK